LSKEKVDPKKICIRQFSSTDHLHKLDFREENNTDPLGVHDFIKAKAMSYHSNHLTSLWSVRYEGKLVGYFTISMNALGTDSIQEEDRVKKATTNRYPAMLIGQMGVDKNFRCRNIGYWICQYCIGLARKITPKIACKVIILHTNEEKSRFYKEKIGFERTTQGTTGKITMYKRVW
jgi:Acetyltransferase (GNAT) family